MAAIDLRRQKLGLPPIEWLKILWIGLKSICGFWNLHMTELPHCFKFIKFHTAVIFYQAAICK